jgi:tetratricopeptide (TPR) repeat protein
MMHTPYSIEEYAIRAVENTPKYTNQQAINDFTTSIAIFPENKGAYLNRGQCYEKLKNMPQAQADYEKAEAS